MISNYEFIKTQSFEVAWAVFRCTELFSQSDLRKKVESAAVDLIADYDMIGNDSEIEFPRIEKLTSLLRLAESVKQITAVNANVLYRELDNLAKATRLEIVERQNKKNVAVSLENIFTNSAYAKNLASSPIASTPVATPSILSKPGIHNSVSSTANPEVVNPANDKSEGKQFGNIESLISAAVQSSQSIAEPVAPADAGIQRTPNSATSSISDLLSAYIKPTSVDSAGSPQASAPVPVIPADAGIKSLAARQSIPATPTNIVLPAVSVSPSAGSWQHVILQKVKELNQTTTKELTSSFPEISERTVRFYLQKLVDNGQIDRIGSTGPGAAYKAK